MKVSIVIPNYNGRQLLEKNLPLVFESIKDFKEVEEVIIIDDGSTDDSVRYLKSQPFGKAQGKQSKVKNSTQNLKVIKNEKNMGFAYSCNRGVKEAKGEVVVLLNNDVVPQKGFLEPLLSHFKDSLVFAVGCKELNGKERGRAVGEFKKGFLVHKRAEDQDKNTTLWVAGGSGAFRKNLFLKLGGFDEIYKPFYWEDIDLSYRAQKSGYKVLFEPKSIVYHRHEQTIGRFFDKMEVDIISYRNSLIFVWKNITESRLLINHFFWLPVNLCQALLKKNKAFILGFIKAIKIFPVILKSRSQAKKFFIKKDSEIFKEFLNG